jgi:hypothetical protein
MDRRREPGRAIELNASWKPSVDHDREIRRWMASKGWEVSRSSYDFDREICAWRHDVKGSPSPTLRISRRVLETYPGFIVVHHLDELKDAKHMRARPEAEFVVVQDGGTVTVKEVRKDSSSERP